MKNGWPNLSSAAASGVSECAACELSSFWWCKVWMGWPELAGDDGPTLLSPLSRLLASTEGG